MFFTFPFDSSYITASRATATTTSTQQNKNRNKKSNMNAINYLKHFRSIRWAIRLNRNSNGRSLVKVFKYSNGTRSGTMLASFITTFPFVVNAWNSKGIKLEEKKILDKADQLFAEDKFNELIQLLKQTPSWYDNCETLWRVARCQYHISKNMKNKNEGSQLLNESFELVKRAIELDEECGAAHKVGWKYCHN